MNLQKQKRWKSEKYEAWVRTLTCSLCGSHCNIECHHIKGVGGFSGVGIKASSILSAPLCTFCHKFVHGNTMQYSQAQLIWALKTAEKAVIEGILK